MLLFYWQEYGMVRMADVRTAHALSLMGGSFLHLIEGFETLE